MAIEYSFGGCFFVPDFLLYFHVDDVFLELLEFLGVDVVLFSVFGGLGEVTAHVVLVY